MELDWENLPTDDEGVPYIEVGEEVYKLPYVDLIEQNVSVDSLAASIEDKGIEYPIIVDDGTNEVIDGMTRLYVAHELGLPEDEIPIKRESVGDDPWKTAIELNAQRRQISGKMRRQLIEEIVSRSNWRKASAHVSDLAGILGVHKSTISRDLDTLYGEEREQKLKKTKRQLNVSLTGMRNLADMLEEGEMFAGIDDDQRKGFISTLESLVSATEDERSRITEELKGGGEE